MEKLELTLLRHSVSQKFGRKISTSADFSLLSEEIEMSVNEMCSTSTLKRLWGYVSETVSEPRRSTLDILSRYAGFRDYKAFSDNLRESSLISSAFFHQDHIDSSILQKGDRVTIGWKPDRVVSLEYLGGDRYKVISSENSILCANDEFEATTIIKGFPLYLSGIFRDGKKTDPYVAGRDGGIVIINNH